MENKDEGFSLPKGVKPIKRDRYTQDYEESIWNFYSYVYSIVVNCFKQSDNGEPFVPTSGQMQIIFNVVYPNKVPWYVLILCHTRYGKSECVAIACLIVACMKPTKISICAEKEELTKNIMEYICNHLSDHPFIFEKLNPEDLQKGKDYSKNSKKFSASEIRRFRKKTHITLTLDAVKGVYSDIYISTPANALGKGCDILILDEAGFITDTNIDDLERMTTQAKEKAKIIKIGNAFNNANCSHFIRDYKDPLYKKLVIDCYQGEKEGRITKQEIERKKKTSRKFNEYYACIFPDIRDVRGGQWNFVFPMREIEEAVERSQIESLKKIEDDSVVYLGFDISRTGKDGCCCVWRKGNNAKILRKWNESDTTVTMDFIKDIIDKTPNVKAENCRIDDGSFGGVIYDVLKRDGYDIVPVRFGSKDFEKWIGSGETKRGSRTGYKNTRSWLYLSKNGVQNWLRSGGILKQDSEWFKGINLMYKENEAGQFVMKRKEDMRKEGFDSPDGMDALACTFANPKNSKIVYNITNNNFEQKNKFSNIKLF